MIDKKTIETYNHTAHTYDVETGHFWDVFPRTFLDTFITLSGRMVLDIGSGPGRDGLLLTAGGKDVTCIDASETMIKLSSARGLNSILAGFEALPFEDQFFDGAWSYTALLHTPKHSVHAPLSEVYRVIKPNGIFALGLIEGETEGYKYEDGMERWFSYYQAEEVIKLCEGHGFELVYTEVFKPRSRNYLNFIFKK
jgi:ubiquinone/menaquinone biosynthesis C-methylase UbiE